MSDKIETSAPLAYRVREFCSRAGISPSCFYKYLKRGRIRVIKIGGRTLIPAAEAERIFREGVN